MERRQQFEEVSILSYFDLRPKEGEIGIEIEMEGEGLPDPDDTPHPWMHHNDGSLRGENAEYVLQEPVHREDVKGSLDRLWDQFDGQDAYLKPSDRCGVHVHVNVQELTSEQVIRFAVLYYILEEVLLDRFPDDRQGNLYCLRALDAQYVIGLLVQTIEYAHTGYLNDDNVRYGALNFSSLGKYGSLEFRSMNTTPQPAPIEAWVRILCAIKDAALRYPSARAIVEDMSSAGPKFMENIFGEDMKLMPKWGPLTQEKLYRGVRLVQDVAYAKIGRRDGGWAQKKQGLMGQRPGVVEWRNVANEVMHHVEEARAFPPEFDEPEPEPEEEGPEQW
jgi:hypothetical protein